MDEAVELARADGGAGHVPAVLAWLAWAVQDAAGDLERARALAEESDALGLARTTT